MICTHCGKPIQPANSFLEDVKYRHTEDSMLTCFGPDGKPIRNGEGYFRAEPKEEK